MGVMLVFNDAGLVEQFVGVSDGHSAEEEGDMNDGLPEQYFFVVIGCIDKGFE
jgi:hypothetical protein